jgi:hypothetical protein
MKLFTPEQVELMEVKALTPSPEGLVIEGQIMGAMPMTAVLTPTELRKAFKLMNVRTALALLGMLFRR